MDEHIIAPETSGNSPTRKYHKSDQQREKARRKRHVYRARARAKDTAAGHYVYLLKHPVTGVAFWVGCSKSRNRLSDHLRNARHANANHDGNFDKNAVIRFMLLALGEKPIFKKVVEGLPPNEAHELESLMIQKIGTLERGSGPLSNLIYQKEIPPGRRPHRKKHTLQKRRRPIDLCFEAILSHELRKLNF